MGGSSDHKDLLGKPVKTRRRRRRRVCRMCHIHLCERRRPFSTRTSFDPRGGRGMPGSDRRGPFCAVEARGPTAAARSVAMTAGGNAGALHAHVSCVDVPSSNRQKCLLFVVFCYFSVRLGWFSFVWRRSTSKCPQQPNPFITLIFFVLVSRGRTSCGEGGGRVLGDPVREAELLL